MDLVIPDFKNKVSKNWIDGLGKYLKDEVAAEKMFYKVRQHRIGESVRAIGAGKRTSDGLGKLVACIDARTYIRWHQQDKHFWEDPSSRKKFFNDNPEVLVKNWTR